MDRDQPTREPDLGALWQADCHPYEPPTLTTLGSFTELTEAIKTGGLVDPGDSFQPSNGV